MRTRDLNDPFDALNFLGGYFQGEGHEDDCPEDDTCECEEVADVNKAFSTIYEDLRRLRNLDR